MVWQPRRFRRRLILSISIALLFMTGLVASLGLVAATSPGDAPATFGVAAPRVGDHGNFTVTVIEDDGDTIIEDERWIFTYTQLPRRDVIDHHGRTRTVDAILLERPGGGSVINGERMPNQVTYFFDAADGTFVGTEHAVYMALGAPGQNGFPAAPSGWDVAQDGARRTMERLGLPGHESEATRLPCFIRNTLQGTELPVHDYVDVIDRGCSAFNFWTPDLPMKARGVETIGGRDAVLLVGDHQVGRLVWFTQDLPVPLRIAIEDQDVEGRFTIVRLAAFERGDGELATPRLGSTQAPAIQWADPEVYGPQEGVDVAFPMSEAWGVASNDPDGPLVDFLAQHPDAWVAVAEFDHQETQKRTIDSWFMLLVDDGTEMMFTIEEVTRPIESENAPWWVPGTSGQMETVYQYHDRTSTSAGAVPDRPPSMPTVASMMARWNAEKGGDHASIEGNGWGFRVLCTADPCAPAVQMWVGFDLEYYDESDLGDFVNPNDGRIFRTSTLSIDRAGDLAVQELRVQSQQTLAPSAPAPVASAGFEGLQSANIGVWSLPPGTWLAGSAVIGILTGLAYLSWPVRKGLGALGLFSRVAGPALLEHPARGRLFLAIEQNPGIHLKELARETSTPRQSADYHVRRLAQSGLVQIKIENGYTCLWPQGRFDRKIIAAMPYLKAKGARKVFLAVADSPDCMAADVARQARLSPSTVSYHLKALETTGLVRRSGDGLALSTLGQEVLAAGHIGTAA